jgi:glycosyltransferase involved in cell wall biosynthesis
MKIFIQIPCFNEELQIENAIIQIRKSLENKEYDYEIVIVDDGSTDRTVDIAKKNGVKKIISLKRNMGLGYAFNEGRKFAYEKGVDILINTDADDQYRAEYIVKLIEHLINSKTDIVVGVRKFDEIDHFSKTKIFLQKLGSKVVRIVSGQKISDASSGFRAYNKDAIKRLRVDSNYSYTLETLIQANEKNLLIGEIPIKTNPPTRKSRLFKSMKEFLIKQMLIIFKTFLLYKPMQFFSSLSILPILIGSFAILRFLYFFIFQTGDGHIQSLILGVALILIGLLLFSLGLLGYLIKSVKKNLEDKL